MRLFYRNVDIIVRKIVNKRDPYSLFPYAPEDEYEKEVKLIEAYIADNREDLSNLPNFLKTIFDSELIFEKEKRNFEMVGKLIANKV